MLRRPRRGPRCIHQDEAKRYRIFYSARPFGASPKAMHLKVRKRIRSVPISTHQALDQVADLDPPAGGVIDADFEEVGEKGERRFAIDQVMAEDADRESVRLARARKLGGDPLDQQPRDREHASCRGSR